VYHNHHHSGHISLVTSTTVNIPSVHSCKFGNFKEANGVCHKHCASIIILCFPLKQIFETVSCLQVQMIQDALESLLGNESCNKCCERQAVPRCGTGDTKCPVAETSSATSGARDDKVSTSCRAEGGTGGNSCNRHA